MARRGARAWGKFCAILLLTIGTSPLCVGEIPPSMAVSRDLSPTAVTYRELDRLLIKVQEIITSANRTMESDGYSLPEVQIAVGSTGREYSLKDWVLLSGLEGLPETALHFSLSYRWRSAPIERVEIRFSDWSRTLKAEGSDSAQVDALVALLSSELDLHSKYMVGPNARMYFGILSTIVVFLLAIRIWAWLGRRYPALAGQSGLTLIGIVAFVGYFWLLNAVPWREVLPGFAVYRESASFVVRFGPWITLSSLLVAIVLPVFLHSLGKQRSSNGASSPEETAGAA